ncbi:uncharacterized protein LOC142976700 [Anticarsia gemmatalis]|uniref:uncharacterized protein LOC142976700 n=1 Tax=Anticarsia gemmatalis TaxID=129554 RepID=UPI003F76F949
MDFIHIIMLTLQITQVITRSRNRKYGIQSSDETIENLLYFKDCQKKPKEQPTTHIPMTLRVPSYLPPPTPPPQPECPFPKMCCALSCGNECGGGRQSSFMSRQMEPLQNMQLPDMPPIEPVNQMRPPLLPVQPQIRKRKKMKIQMDKMQPPIGSRRSFGFTKEKIKSVISQDDDIRKILKDLVRVTMQKVDLMDMVNGPQNVPEQTPVTSAEYNLPTTPESMYDDYDE